MAQRSTNTNLLLHFSFIVDNIDQCNQVDAVYTDFSKAFDKVNHVSLLKELFAYGISNTLLLLTWCETYLIAGPIQ